MMLISPRLDVGLSLTALLYGIAWAGVGFIIAALLEAWLMRVYLKSYWRKSLWYSFVMNLASSVVGVGLASASIIIPIPFLIIFAYLLTVVIEFFCLKVMFRPPTTNSVLVRFVAFANLVSYLVVFILPWAFDSVILLQSPNQK